MRQRICTMSAIRLRSRIGARNFAAIESQSGLDPSSRRPSTSSSRSYDWGGAGPAIRSRAAAELFVAKAASRIPDAEVQTRLRHQIDATDRQIDQLVYELYGLTVDEIRTVEEAREDRG